MSLGKTIIRLRMQKQWKQKDLAEKLGVHQRQVSRWESDQVAPRGRALARIAEALEVSVGELGSDGHRSVRVEDLELQKLLDEVPTLERPQQEALKVLLQDMVTRRRLEAVLSRSA